MEDYIGFLSSSLPPEQHYHAICGVSLGGNVANGLFKFFADPKNGRRAPERMVLLEPGVEVKMPRMIVERINKSADVPKTEEQLKAENPGWTTTDLAVDRLGLVRTNKEAFQAMFSGVSATLQSWTSQIDPISGDPN